MLSSLRQNQIPDRVSIKRTSQIHIHTLASAFSCQVQYIDVLAGTRSAPATGQSVETRWRDMGITTIQPNAGQHESTGGCVARGSSWSVRMSCAVCQLWERGHEQIMVAAVC